MVVGCKGRSDMSDACSRVSFAWYPLEKARGTEQRLRHEIYEQSQASRSDIEIMSILCSSGSFP